MISQTIKELSAIGVKRSLPLYASGTPTKAWIKQGPVYYPLASLNISHVLKKSSVVRISGFVSYFTPAVAGKSFIISINGVGVAQCFPTASALQLSFEMYLYIDSKGVTAVRSQVFIGTGSAGLTDGTGNQFGTNTSSARTSSTIALTGNDTLTIETMVAGSASSSGEFHQLDGFCCEILNTTSPLSYNSNAVACWGDSLTTGAGATFGSTDYPHVLGKLRIGKPFYNGGVSGETAAQILTRFLADEVHGKEETAVLWLGRNNVGSPTMQADVLSALASAVAALNHSRYIIMPVLNASTEPNGSANKIAIDALNAAIASTYPAANFLDIVAVICTEANGTPNPAWLSDTIHLNATGYAAVAAAVDAKLTANVW